MPRFAANLTTMFGEWSFLDRFAAAADAGFKAVEIQFPYHAPADQVASRLSRANLSLVMFNVEAGTFGAAERGYAACPDRFDEVKASVARAIVYAEITGAKLLHLLSGTADRHDAVACDAYRRSIAWSAEEAGRSGIDLLIEPVNDRDLPGYFLNDFDFAERLIAALALPNLKLQFDFYHRQLLHGDVTAALQRMIPIIGHVQISSTPGRREPMSGELNDAFLLETLDALGYQGVVGCEYAPRDGTLAGLGWLDQWRDPSTKTFP